MSTRKDDYPNQLESLLSSYQEIIDTETTHDELIVDGYKSSITDLEDKYLKSPPTRPRQLTIPEIFHRSYDENFISDYLAYILNPEINGIGIQPLSTIFQLLYPEIQEPNFNNVEIQREYDVGGGRIDFLIRADDSSIIGIENKLYSPEGDQQTIYYANMIEKEFSDFDRYYIFLTPNGAKASSRKFVSLSYSQIWELFRSIQYDWQDDIRKSLYWEDFLSHLEIYIMKQQEFEFSPRARLYLENFVMIEDLQRAFKQDWPKFIEMIESKLRSHLPDVNWKTNFNPTSYNWHQIYSTNWDFPNLAIHYEYHFSPKSFSNSEFAFMFEAEGKRSNDFISLFEKKIPLLTDKYKKLDIQFRPNNRKWAVAYKKYQFETPPESWAIEFINAFEEFSFLTPYIDETIQEFKSIETK